MNGYDVSRDYSNDFEDEALNSYYLQYLVHLYDVIISHLLNIILSFLFSLFLFHSFSFPCLVSTYVYF